MSRPILLSLVSLALVSSLGLIGVFTLSWSEEKLRRSMPKLIAIAAGVLIGEACFHLIPDSIGGGMTASRSALLVGLGVLISFAIEKGSHMGARPSEIDPVARISLISESMHNAVDGAIIAGAYLAGPATGLYATLAIAIHEIPHELGNFAILVHAGYGRSRAIALNMISAGFAILGGLTVLAVHSSMAEADWILPFAAGCFLYMAIVDLVPNLWQAQPTRGRASIGYGVSAGMAVMLLLAWR